VVAKGSSPSVGKTRGGRNLAGGGQQAHRLGLARAEALRWISGDRKRAAALSSTS
jgi:hypothetical protein